MDRTVTQHLVSLHVFRVSSIFGLEQVGNAVGAFEVWPIEGVVQRVQA